jgi:hypothetical protein
MRSENIPPMILNAVRVNERSSKETDEQYTLRVFDTVVKLIEQEINKDHAFNQYQQDKAKHIFTNPDKQDVIVLAKDLPAFCRAFHLNQDEMIKLSNGWIESHKKYTRPHVINPEYNGMPYKKPIDYTEHAKRGENEVKASQAFHQANPAYKVTQPSKPPIVFQPSL